MSPDERSPGPDSEIRITRVLDAPRTRVWKAWTEAEHIAEWWGPEGYEARVEEHDLRPGGRWRYVMVGSGGEEYPSEGEFREVEAPERIVTTDEFPDDFPYDLDLPTGIVVTCLFEDLGDRTRLSLRIAHTDTDNRRKHEEMGAVEGWSSSLDCLEALLKELETGE